MSNYQYAHRERGPSRRSSPEYQPDPRRTTQSSRSREPSADRSRGLPSRTRAPPSNTQSYTTGRRRSSFPGRRWPPRPKVEEFIKAAPLIHDNSSSILYSDNRQPPNRGTIGQEQLLIDVNPPAPRSSANTAKSAKKRTNSRDWTSKRDSKFESETHFTPNASDISTASTAESGYYSSLDKGASRKGFGLTDSAFSDAWLESGRYERGDRTTRPSQYSGDVPSAAVSDDEGDSLVSSHGSRTPSRYAGAGAGQKERFSREIPKGDVKLPGPTIPPRRNTENSFNTARPRFDGMPQPFRKDSLPVQSSTNSGSSLSSTVQYTPAGTPSPPQSPRYNNSRADGQISRSARSSQSGGSRPSSPTSSQPPRSDDPLRRAATFPIVVDDRTQRTSRLATSSMTIDQLESPVASPARMNLPYPVDDTFIMPSAEDHAFKPERVAEHHIPRAYGDDTRTQRSGRPPSIEIPSPRPRMDTRRTYDGSLPVIAAGSQLSSAVNAPQTPRASPRTPKTPAHTACLVSQGRRDAPEWCVLPDTPISQVAICPYCVETKLASTAYAAKVNRHGAAQPDSSVQCAFASKWHVLAWEIIQLEKAKDLRLLGSVSRIEHDSDRDGKSCPGPTPKSGKWLALRTRSGDSSPAFYICAVDARKLFKLLPELKNEFEEVNSRHRQTCALHEDSHRFEKYTRPLVAADNEAHRKRSRPDLSRFVQLVKVLSQTSPCQKDNFIKDARWHYASSFPSLTVCPECFATVVYPEIDKGSSVAKKIADTDQPVSREHSLGQTCQLWSPRMMTVFKTAIKNNDSKFLADEAAKRAEMERSLRLQWTQLDQDERELSRIGGLDRDRQLYWIQSRRHELAAQWKLYE